MICILTAGCNKQAVTELFWLNKGNRWASAAVSWGVIKWAVRFESHLRVIHKCVRSKFNNERRRISGAEWRAALFLSVFMQQFSP